MYTRRRSSLFPKALVFLALGFVLASLVGNAGSAAAAVVLLPLLALKMLFIVFIFGTMMRFAFGGGGGPWHGSRHHRARTERPVERREPTAAEREWEQARRTARDEVDEMFPDPQD